MKVAALQDNKFIITTRPKPILDEYGEGAIIKVLGCGLCGSDIVKIRNGQAKNGDVLGHEVVGEIVEINSKTNFGKNSNEILTNNMVGQNACSIIQSFNQQWWEFP